MIAALLLLAGCSPSAQPRVASPPARPPRSARATPAPPARLVAVATAAPSRGSAPSQPTLTPLEPEEAPAPGPHVEIAFPFAEQRLRPEKAASSRIRLKLERWRADGVRLALDDFAPRRLSELSRPVTLGALLPDGVSLAPGEHLLVAVAVGEDGRAVAHRSGSSLEPFAAVKFWVGPRREAAIDMSQLMVSLSEPSGLAASPGDDTLRFDLTVLNAYRLPAAPRVRVSVEGGGAALTAIVGGAGAFALRGLQGGEYQLSATLVDAAGAPLPGRFATATRTFTVGPEPPRAAHGPRAEP
ncbi:MAG: hypothetical protein OZ921_05285 [Sorangiineae bacterium]|nr:hypothetical protein [Polyangiaceae bacterium]MEB2321906.1 hypothetical protein [Sorangiineae bacterium]